MSLTRAILYTTFFYFIFKKSMYQQKTMMKMQMIAFALFVYVFVYMANDNTKLDLVFEHLKFQPAAINVAEIEKWQNSTLFYSLPKYLAPALACLKDILFSHWNVEPIKLLPMSDVPLEHKQMQLYNSKKNASWEPRHSWTMTWRPMPWTLTWILATPQ